MKIFQEYLNNIELAMSAGGKRRLYTESVDSFDGGFYKGISSEQRATKLSAESLMPSLQQFASDRGLRPKFDQKLGSHPHFAHLKGTDKIEKHYIVSTFIDIKGSTGLFRRYDPETVLIVNDTIQKAAIHTCLIFGGYIHRLQGDGLFVYYGGKGIERSDAVKSALLSTAIFSYFVKNDLKRVFDQQGIDRIFTRIGIDLGDDADVIWSSAGIGEISEVTTCSLHTSLAPKMQSNATSNGIVVGDNVKNQSRVEDFFSPVCRRTEDERDRYIFQIPEENFRYTQHDFDWLKFLKQQDFIATDQHGNLIMKDTRPQVLKDAQNLYPIAVKNTPYFETE